MNVLQVPYDFLRSLRYEEILITPLVPLLSEALVLFGLSNMQVVKHIILVMVQAVVDEAKVAATPLLVDIGHLLGEVGTVIVEYL